MYIRLANTNVRDSGTTPTGENYVCLEIQSKPMDEKDAKTLQKLFPNTSSGIERLLLLECLAKTIQLD